MALLKLGEGIRTMSDDEKIEFNKRKSKLMSKVRKEIKPEKCLYCGKETSQLCSSHTIPQFILRQLCNKKGKIYNSNVLVNISTLKTDTGIKNTGIFKLICRECDSKLFSNYENPITYTNKDFITDKVLAQIVLKTYLRKINQVYKEFKIYEELETNFYNGNVSHFDRRKETLKNDLKEDEFYIQEAKKILNRNNQKGHQYHIAYYKKLDYVVPLAFQDVLVLLTDFSRKIINNVYTNKLEHNLQGLHICIFPLENSSILMMFYRKKDTCYKDFFRVFNKYNQDEQLNILCYMIVLYSDDIFFSKQMKKDVLENKKLKDTAKQTSIIKMDIFNYEQKSYFREIIEKYDLNNYKDIPNLLSKKYAINR